MKYLIEN